MNEPTAESVWTDLLQTLGKAAGYLERDDLRHFLADAVARGFVKREYITLLRDRCNEVLAGPDKETPP